MGFGGCGGRLSRGGGKRWVEGGCLGGDSTLRRVVMGADAVGKQATPEQIGAMVELLHESIEQGGLGFSSSRAPTHNDGEGRPVPSRHAAREEFLALAQTLRDHEGTVLELLPGIGMFDAESIELMIDMSLAANRPLNWNVLGVASYAPELHQAQPPIPTTAAEPRARIVAPTPAPMP